MSRLSLGSPLRSLRLRILLLVVAALIPAILYLAHLASRQRSATIAQVQGETLRAAQLAALHGHQLMDRLEETLETAARSPEVRARNLEASRKRFSADLAASPNLVSEVLASRDGRVLVGAYKASGGTGVSDRLSFQRALARGMFAVGDPRVDSTTGVATITGSYPVFDPDGRVTSAVVATINTEFGGDIAATVDLRAGAEVFLVDTNGRVLARYPEPSRWVGQRVPVPELGALLRGRSDGARLLTGPDGAKRYYGFTYVHGSTPHSFYAVSGIPLRSVMMEARRSTQASVLGLAIAVAAALVLAWAGIEALLVRRVRDLVDTTRQLRDGHLAARTNVPYGDDEVSELARSFDTMAESLEARVAERDRAEGELARANERLTAWVGELQQRTREITLLSEMGELLRASHTTAEVRAVVQQVAVELFPGSHGALYLLDAASGELRPACTWGQTETWGAFRPDQCWALRLGHVHQFTRGHEGVACEHAASRERVAICVPITASGAVLGVYHLLLAAAGDEVPYVPAREDTVRKLCEAVAEHVALTLSNIRLQETLREQAFRDPLTNLYNRRFLEEALGREIVRAARQSSPLSVMMIDLDGFKPLNDSLGHAAGDEVLRRVGHMLGLRVRGDDVACRFGGDEFVIVMPGATQPDAAARAEQIRRVIESNARPSVGPARGITATIGVATYPGNGATAEVLLRGADTALYHGKKAGGNQVALLPEEVATLTAS